MFSESPLATDLVKDCVDVLAAVQGHVDHLRQVVHVESKCGSIYINETLSSLLPSLKYSLTSSHLISTSSLVRHSCGMSLNFEALSG